MITFDDGYESFHEYVYPSYRNISIRPSTPLLEHMPTSIPKLTTTTSVTPIPHGMN